MAQVAGRLYDGLASELGARSVVRDLQSIDLGADWKSEVERLIQSAAAIVLLIGSRWSDAGDLHDADDPLALELRLAKKYNVPLIPLRVDAASMPSADVFPPDLAWVASVNAGLLRDSDFASDVSRVLKVLATHGVHSRGVSAWIKRNAGWAAAVGLGVAGLAIGVNDLLSPDYFVGTIDYGGRVSSIDFSPDGRLIATGGGNDYTTALWDAATGEQLRLLTGQSVVSAVAFSGDGRWVASDANLFEIATGERVAALSGGYDVAFSPDGRFLATASGYEPTLGTRLYEQSTGMLIAELSDEYASAVAFSHDGTLLATATGYLEQGVRVWDLESYAMVTTLEGPSSSVAFSPNGRYVSTAGGGTVRLFRPRTWEPLRDIDGDIVAFSPDERLLATVGEDRSVRLYDPATGNPVRTLESVYATQLVFSPDGERIAAVGPNGSIQVSTVE